MPNPSSPTRHIKPALASRHSRKAGIVGAGLMGRLLALQLLDHGWQVTLFDQDDISGTQSCAYTGAGMLSPISELETAEPIITQLGLASIPLWEHWISRFQWPVFLQKAGTLVVAHPLDTSDLKHFRDNLQAKIQQYKLTELLENNQIQWHLNQNDLDQLEPQINARFATGIYIPNEGQIDNRQLLPCLAQTLIQSGVAWYFKHPVHKILPFMVKDQHETWHFDCVFDCRGLGAKKDLNNLRGVRGEIIRVYAPEVTLNRPIRLMHPRYPIYIVPRENHHFLIGATSIESEDFRPLTIQSALELLSAAFTVHPGFSEASILENNVNCRPALPDHLPCIQITDGLIRINGLYRHGFLIAPKLAELVCQVLIQTVQTEKLCLQCPSLFQVNYNPEKQYDAVAR